VTEEPPQPIGVGRRLLLVRLEHRALPVPLHDAAEGLVELGPVPVGVVAVGVVRVRVGVVGFVRGGHGAVTRSTKVADSAKIVGASLSSVATWQLSGIRSSRASRDDTRCRIIRAEDGSTTWSSAE